MSRTSVGRPLQVVDLFSGAGGFSLGFHAAGFEIAAAWDHDEAAARTYARNFTLLQPHAPPLVNPGGVGDVAAIDFDRFDLHPDVLIGGPPCQGFSLVGRGKLNSLRTIEVEEGDPIEGIRVDPRNALYRSYLAAARHWKPAVVVMENVPGMLSIAGRNVADVVAADVAACGYRVGYALLNAVWYGVPQFRSRLILVGVRSDLGVEPTLPASMHRGEIPSTYAVSSTDQLALPFGDHFQLSVDTGRATQPFVTVEDAIGDLPPIDDHLRPPAVRWEFRASATRRPMGEPMISARSRSSWRG